MKAMMSSAWKANAPAICAIAANGKNLSEWLEGITAFMSFMRSTDLLFEDSNQYLQYSDQMTMPYDSKNKKQELFLKFSANRVIQTIQVKIEAHEVELGKKGHEVVPRDPEQIYNALKKREGSCAIRGIEMRVFNQQVFWLDPLDREVLENDHSTTARTMCWYTIVASLKQIDSCTIMSGIVVGNIYALVARVQSNFDQMDPQFILHGLMKDIMSFGMMKSETFPAFHARFLVLLKRIQMEGTISHLQENFLKVQIQAAIRGIPHLFDEMRQVQLAERTGNWQDLYLKPSYGLSASSGREGDDVSAFDWCWPISR